MAAAKAAALQQVLARQMAERKAAEEAEAREEVEYFHREQEDLKVRAAGVDRRPCAPASPQSETPVGPGHFTYHQPLALHLVPLPMKQRTLLAQLS